MKKTILALALVFCAFEASAQVYGDIAKVISAKPISEKVPSPCAGTDTAKGYERLGPSQPEPNGGYRRISLVNDCVAPKEKRERIVGYDVLYQYNGREFHARMPFDPGKEMPVNVEVRPPMAESTLAPRPPNYRGTY
jgi:uncharacterized protein YcfJ